MSGLHYLFCWISVVLITANVWTENWTWLAAAIGTMVLVIADAVVEAIKEAGK